MELTKISSALSNQQELSGNENLLIKSKPSNFAIQIPTFEKLISRIQETAIEPEEDPIPFSVDSEEFQAELQKLPTLLQQDKAKAQKIIKQIVSSAKNTTHEVASSLSAVPLHPYEKLIYDYLGPKFVAPTIDQYIVPSNFNPSTAVRELEKIYRKTSELENTHYACISAEAMNMTFDGTFATENLNNAFAVPSTDSEGNPTFKIDKERLTEHLKFAEMVKNIPTEHIIKNPIAVAKILLSEFVRIHKVEDHEINSELVSDRQVSLQQLLSDPFEITKKMLSDYQALNGGSSDFDLAAIFKAYDRLKDAEILQSSKPPLAS